MKWDEDKTISFVQSQEVSWNLLLQSEWDLSPFCVTQQPFVSGESNLSSDSTAERETTRWRQTQNKNENKRWGEARVNNILEINSTWTTRILFAVSTIIKGCKFSSLTLTERIAFRWRSVFLICEKRKRYEFCDFACRQISLTACRLNEFTLTIIKSPLWNNKK